MTVTLQLPFTIFTCTNSRRTKVTFPTFKRTSVNNRERNNRSDYEGRKIDTVNLINVNEYTNEYTNQL